MRNSIVVLVFTLLASSLTTAQPRVAETLAGESWIAYRIVHPLHVIDAKSTSAQYSVELDPTTKEIKSVTAQVDVTTFDSGNSNRDSHAMEVVDALTYPDVLFTSTSIIQRGDSVWATGKLTFHGVTNEITMAGASKWQQNKLEVSGAFDLSLTAFKVERPSLLMIPVEDKLGFTLAAAFSWK